MDEPFPIERVKMAATIGPATADPEILDELLREGIDCIRINASHVEPEKLAHWVDLVRESGKRVGHDVPVLVDLPGIKFRIGDLEDPIELKEGQIVRLGGAGPDRIPASIESLLPHIKVGSDIFLADGFVRLWVQAVESDTVVAKVGLGGVIKARAGINLPGVPVKARIPTKRDEEHIAAGLAAGVDVFGLSFVRTADEVRRSRKLVNGVPIISKIERPEAVDNIVEIAAVSDGLMVARGDLAVEMAPEQLPVLQKKLVKAANLARKPVIVATELLASMVSRPRPTRAELTDVGNAVLDGCDAVMLSNETAVGEYPVRAVRFLKRIVQTVEHSLLTHDLDVPKPGETDDPRPDWAVADAAVNVAARIGARAILAFTGSGRTARLISANRPSVPLLSFSPDPAVRRRCALMWGVNAFVTEAAADPVVQIENTFDLLRKYGKLKKGEHVVIVFGSPLWKEGTKTNSLRIWTA
jgi:pyruvate kinase